MRCRMKKFEIEKTEIVGLNILRLSKHSDTRGSFQKIFSAVDYSELGLSQNIKQINRSYSKKRGTIRGMHFQKWPYTEAKYVTCISGSIFDVAVDLRKNSKTFCCWSSQVLTSGKGQVFCIPPGFAHGFQTLEDNVEVLYLHTEEYVPNSEDGIAPNDPRIAIDWPLDVTIISDRDASFVHIDEYFEGINI